MRILVQLYFKNFLCHVIFGVIKVLHGVRISLSRTYIFLATRRGKWVALSQIIGFVYIYMASNSIYGLAFNRFAACQLAVSIAWVKCERRVQYSCTLPFDTFFSCATLVSLTKEKKLSA